MFFLLLFVLFFLGILFLPVNTMKVGQTGDPMWLGIGTLWIMDLTEILLVWNILPIHSVYCEIFNFLGDKFVTLLETYNEIRCIVLRVLQTSKGFFGFFCSVNHFSEDGVNTNHNNVLSQLGWEWLYTVQERKRRKSRWWADFLSKEGDWRCFILASDKKKKDRKNLRCKLN